jgi:hypothetical protein
MPKVPKASIGHRAWSIERNDAETRRNGETENGGQKSEVGGQEELGTIH